MLKFERIFEHKSLINLSLKVEIEQLGLHFRFNGDS